MADINLSSLSGVPFGTTAQRPSNPSIGQLYYNGSLATIEIYSSVGWAAVSGIAPDTPVSLSAADVGTNVTYGNGTVDVSFTPGGGGASTSFIITPTPATSPTTFTGTSSPIRIQGLTVGTAYTFVAQSRNGIGTSIASAATNSVTPTSIPQTPTIGSPSNVTGVSYGTNPSIDVPVTANATGGKSITGFTVTSSPGSITATGSSPVRVTGLTAGTTYTFTAIANNANGSSTATSASSSALAATIPQAPTIGTATATGTSGQVSVTFTGGANGGSSITGYTVTSSPGNITATGSSSPILVTGLTDKTNYTFTVTATNAAGTSTSSSASNSASPYSPTIALAAGGYGNSGNSGGSGGSGGGSAANSGGVGGGRGGYNGSDGDAGTGNRQGAGQLSLAYGSGTNTYIPTGGLGTGAGPTTPAYAGLGPNSAGAGTSLTWSQQNSSTRLAGYGRGCGGSEGDWTGLGSAGQDGLVAWTNTNGGSGTFNDTVASWNPPINSTYTFYAIGGGGGGGGGYYGPGGGGYYDFGTRTLTTSNNLTITIGSGGARGARFGNGARGGTTSVVVNS